MSGYIETVNGRERLAEPGSAQVDGTRWPDDWSGWQLVRAADIPAGYTVRLSGYQFPAQVENFNDERTHVTIRRGEGLVPFLVWGGCLVWTYLGSS